MEFRPTAPRGAVKVKFVPGSLSRFSGKELVVGWGGKKPLTQRKFVLLARKIVALAKQNKIKILSIDYKDLRSLAAKPANNPHPGLRGMDDYELGVVAGCAFVMTGYEPRTYKSKPKDGWGDVEVIAVTNTPQICKDGFWRGHQVATEVNACRELANMPGGDMTPKVLASAAKRAVKGTKAKVKVLGRKEMQKLGMGAILGIAKGSAEEPQFIIVEYKGGPKSQKPIVLVGKGVTFDTGGLQIKPGDHMYEMHMDMSGGAAVIHAVALAAKLGIKRNVVALVPAVENAPGQNAVRPGDILRSLSGKTIEILHTDAEGRVILADAITYAKRYNPTAVVDVATLTGASLVALGVQASAFMFNQDEIVPTVMEYAEVSGDYLWPMPSWEEYEDMTKGTFGDVPNISTAGNSRYGGVIAGGMFLKEFAKDLGCLWVHIDMAPRMTSAPGEHLAKGAAGAPVRFLLEFIEKFQKEK